jgi:hypothetical protein
LLDVLFKNDIKNWQYVDNDNFVILAKNIELKTLLDFIESK